MVTDFQHQVAGIVHKHRLIVGVGAVGRISQPEVLPHHDTIAVAGLIEFPVAGHAHPVANHVVVHLLVVTHGSIKLPATVIQVVLAKGPVASKRHQPAVVDIYLQFCVLVNGLHLTDACLVLDGIALLPIDDELKACIVQIGLSISVGPPQVHSLILQLLEFARIK